MAIAGTAVSVGCWTSPVQTHLEHSLRVQRCPTIASAPSSRPYATQSEAPKESVAPCARELTGENSPHYTNQPRKRRTDRVPLKYLFFSTAFAASQGDRNQLRSRPKQVQLLRSSRARLLGDATQSFEQTLDAVADGERRTAAAPRQLRAGETFQFKSNEKLPFFLGEPSPVLAFIEKVGEENRCMGRVAARFCLLRRGVRMIRLVRELDPRFADGPAERAAAHLSRNREGEMRSARAEFLGVEEFQ
jgi:hypothetical protein